jgi:hypothetical protein
MELFEEPDGELQHLPRPVQSFENYWTTLVNFWD